MPVKITSQEVENLLNMKEEEWPVKLREYDSETLKNLILFLEQDISANRMKPMSVQQMQHFEKCEMLLSQAKEIQNKQQNIEEFLNKDFFNLPTTKERGDFLLKILSLMKHEKIGIAEIQKIISAQYSMNPKAISKLLSHLSQLPVYSNQYPTQVKALKIQITNYINKEATNLDSRSFTDLNDNEKYLFVLRSIADTKENVRNILRKQENIHAILKYMSNFDSRDPITVLLKINSVESFTLEVYITSIINRLEISSDQACNDILDEEHKKEPLYIYYIFKTLSSSGSNDLNNLIKKYIIETHSKENFFEITSTGRTAYLYNILHLLQITQITQIEESHEVFTQIKNIILKQLEQNPKNVSKMLLHLESGNYQGQYPNHVVILTNVIKKVISEKANTLYNTPFKDLNDDNKYLFILNLLILGNNNDARDILNKQESIHEILDYIQHRPDEDLLQKLQNYTEIKQLILEINSTLVAKRLKITPITDEILKKLDELYNDDDNKDQYLFCDTITYVLIKIPIITPQGTTYDLETLQKGSKSEDPFTKETLSVEQLIPNLLFKKLAELHADPDANSQAILDSLKCPLTHQTFEDPVVASDGETYERVALQNYIRANNGMTPTLGIKQTHDIFNNRYTNRFVKDLIENKYKDDLAALAAKELADGNQASSPAEEQHARRKKTSISDIKAINKEDNADILATLSKNKKPTFFNENLSKQAEAKAILQKLHEKKKLEKKLNELRRKK